MELKGVKAFGYEATLNLVRFHISEGWQLLGPIAPDCDSGWYIATMVKQISATPTFNRPLGALKK
jgi:hypothetical protein